MTLFAALRILAFCLSLVCQNFQVTEAWNKIAKEFKCSPIEGESVQSV